jgi:methylenetetrahydrofolate--tRNA-(uracil-5-)-methyltransferase
VGFQTRLTIGEQRNVFRLIPGLGNVEFLRYGSIHRNTYIDSPQLLANDLSFRTMPSVFCAGQLCGSEGYTESVATGHLAARALLGRLAGRPFVPPPVVTALGALLNHVTRSEVKPFAPSNINFGLFPAMPVLPGRRKRGKKERDERLCNRARESLAEWKKRNAGEGGS